ncbi:hypothetical protein ATO8_15263 [Roseivivax marinus]|jgi:hypothetical protein|uniref:Uncharacterized protein n=1 Tax=Roseivivax marinus TaxID=1379903 RepID=W4HGT7_9RHOB|nr:hypothetical protein [Roseivivax marinus]ETW11618.1 hypothetical protein ATO8_15263 [Roseivivax marinus]
MMRVSKGLAVIAAGLALSPVAAAAQNIEWINAVAVIAEDREGMELHLRADEVTDDLSRARVMRGICDHFLPSAVPLIKELTKVQDPDFVKVRITTRAWEQVLGAGGRWEATFAIENATCGDEDIASRRTMSPSALYLR